VKCPQRRLIGHSTPDGVGRLARLSLQTFHLYEVVWSLDIFPKGDLSSSPGLLYSATLGKKASEVRNPNGVVAKAGRVHQPNGLPSTWRTAATPLGLRESSLLFLFPR
jgi:hypothetical protein